MGGAGAQDIVSDIHLNLYIQTKFGCSTFIVFRRWGERPNERVITVGIGWVLLASATSGFSGYIKLAYCSSAKGAPVAQLVRASD